MIKLGQFLSSRADLLPEQALAVLVELQDEVPAEPFEHVEGHTLVGTLKGRPDGAHEIPREMVGSVLGKLGSAAAAVAIAPWDELRVAGAEHDAQSMRELPCAPDEWTLRIP